VYTAKMIQTWENLEVSVLLDGFSMRVTGIVIVHSTLMIQLCVC
jgi:hypothetical protein